MDKINLGKRLRHIKETTVQQENLEENSMGLRKKRTRADAFHREMAEMKDLVKTSSGSEKAIRREYKEDEE